MQPNFDAAESSGVTADTNASGRQWRGLLKGLGFIAVLVGAAFAAKALGVADLFDKRFIDAEVRGHGALGLGIFIAATTAFTALGLPRQIPSFLGGYAFGFLFGGLIALIGTALGCVPAFFYARTVGRKPIMSRFGRRVKRLDAFLRDNTLPMTVFIRLLPVGSNLVTNLTAGVSGVRLLPFLLGSLIGLAPQTFIFALLGSGVDVNPGLRLTAAIVLYVVSSLIGYRLYRRCRPAWKAADAATSQAEPGLDCKP
jgi:uncharacterized membrane protein YdjX (TVP38/TMEM64 family)